MIQSDDLCSLLWSRIEPYLKPLDIQSDPHDVHIHGIESLIKGTWQPYGLNSVSTVKPVIYDHCFGQPLSLNGQLIKSILYVLL